MNMQNKLQIMLDKQDITEVIYRHARSLDRMDAELMKSTYWKMRLKITKTQYSQICFSITTMHTPLLNLRCKVLKRSKLLSIESVMC